MLNENMDQDVIYFQVILGQLLEVIWCVQLSMREWKTVLITNMFMGHSRITWQLVWESHNKQDPLCTIWSSIG